MSRSRLYQHSTGEGVGSAGVSPALGGGGTERMECTWLCLALGFPLISNPTSCDRGTKTYSSLSPLISKSQ